MSCLFWPYIWFNYILYFYTQQCISYWWVTLTIHHRLDKSKSHTQVVLYSIPYGPKNWFGWRCAESKYLFRVLFFFVLGNIEQWCTYYWCFRNPDENITYWTYPPGNESISSLSFPCLTGPGIYFFQEGSLDLHLKRIWFFPPICCVKSWRNGVVIWCRD